MTGSGAGAGGTGAGSGWAATIAPSQPAAAVAGVQKLSRQHNSFVPFFQTKSPWPLRQLSIAETSAKAEPATVEKAIKAATLFNFFMILLIGKRKAAAWTAKIRRSECKATQDVAAIVPSFPKKQPRSLCCGAAIRNNRCCTATLQSL